MAVQRLVLDSFDDEDYELIAIHCSLPPYRLAFLINKYLGIKLARTEDDVLFNFQDTIASFQLYKYEDEFRYNTYNLITNIFRVEQQIGPNDAFNLFNTVEKRTIAKYLIPEYKSVDFFLKITSETDQIFTKNFLSRLQGITQIVTAYTVDYTQLKSKNNLIFE